MLIFYFFAIVVIGLGILSLRTGLRFAAYVKNELRRPLPKFTPFASVIAPGRGLEAGLAENIAALFQQNYPAFEVVFVTDRAGDPSLGVFNEVSQIYDHSAGVSARVVIAGAARDCGQKVHNLRSAVAEVDPRSEVLVFVDTDARPHPTWLQSLIAPLVDPELGATTGYRWFVPLNGGFASQLRSVWNAAIASALGKHADRNFCWGGSTAIRKETFAKLKISEHWRGSVSDDFTLTRILQEARLPIHFVPACLVASPGDCDWGELLEFTNRQLKITRVYAPHLWRPLLIGSFLFCVVFFGGAALVIARAFLHLPYALPLALLALIYALGAAKSWVRLHAVARALPVSFGKSLPAQLLLWPFASALYLCNAVVAAGSRRIKWRGITYELKSATEAVIIARES
jgi:cellulose synthase/poly-beta-1,6-N-acetylglucosamine synthase-like glycosyltransferase